MIRIGLINSDDKRDFSAVEAEEMIVLWRRLTKKASDQSLMAVSRYGHMEQSDPERNFLKDEVNDILQNWAAKIRRLGGEPRELWTIAWHQEGQERTWQLEAEHYSLDEDLT
ncbi:MAG: hypothetical protein HRT44_05610 [Bdellovibrionales bacterium]|nr:hypothetical protein [Bdellovibrionales bacterium]NQZ18720.1 hypothetical protein [Bdellovibrionales bacterium]